MQRAAREKSGQLGVLEFSGSRKMQTQSLVLAGVTRPAKGRERTEVQLPFILHGPVQGNSKYLGKLK